MFTCVFVLFSFFASFVLSPFLLSCLLLLLLLVLLRLLLIMVDINVVDDDEGVVTVPVTSEEGAISVKAAVGEGPALLTMISPPLQ